MNKEELRIYHRNWKRNKRKDPEFRKYSSNIHKKWAMSDKGKKWVKENSNKYLVTKLENNRRRRIFKKGVKGFHSPKQWEERKRLFDNKCAICGITEKNILEKWVGTQFTKLTKDHILPLTKGGTENILNIQPLCISCNARKHNNVRVGFTASAFDYLHSGHVAMLKEAKTQCDYLVVGLHTNPQIDRPQKNKPIQTTFERYLQLQGSKYVNEIIPYDTEVDLVNLLKVVKPDIRIIGVEYKDKEFTGKNLDIPVYFNNREHNFSTTSLRERTIKNAK